MKILQKYILVPKEKWEKLNFPLKEAKEINVTKQIGLGKLNHHAQKAVVKKKKKKKKKKKAADLQIQKVITVQDKKKKNKKVSSVMKKSPIVMNKINQKKKKKSERKIKSKKSLYDMVKNYKAELKDAIKLLITFISTQEDITWNSKGELYFKNRKIRHSNIGDLIKHAVDNSIHEKVVGKEEFYKI